MLFFCGIGFSTYAQDTTTSQGFNEIKVLIDSVNARFLLKKPGLVKPYFPPDTLFKKKWLELDSKVNRNILNGQYLVIRNKSQKTFVKAHKSIKKYKMNPTKMVRDSFLVTKAEPADGQIQSRVTLYYKQRKLTGELRFVIWNINGLWYVRGEFEWRGG